MKIKWPNNAKVAVSLTYDDALPVHIDHVSGIHERNESRATFYTDIGERFMQRHEGWKCIATRGHEIGNHSLFHPCRKSGSMDWLDDSFDLKQYNPLRFRKELEVANFILNLTDGKTLRSYGNNCCNTTIGLDAKEESMEPILKTLFGAARGPLNNRIIEPDLDFNMYELGHFSGDGKSFDEIRQLIEQAMDLGGWIVFMFHGVGEGTHSLNIDKLEHDTLLDWIGAKSDTIWSRPVIEVAEYLKSAQSETANS